MNGTPDKSTTLERVRQLVEAGSREAASLSKVVKRLPPPVAVRGFEIIEEIGRGGMGVVYRAIQLSTKRVVALKIMLAGWFASRSARKRFQREVELAARFQHPGIVRILESDLTSTGQQYYAMDHVDGVHLDRWISTSRPDVPTTLRLFTEVCEAVEHAHQKGVVHRDLKPANVLVDANGKPHILDFGLSKAIDQTGVEDALSMVTSMTGQVMGTLRYLSPEQAAGTPADVDARTDVYAIGGMLFEALTGQLPLDTSGNSSDVMLRIREEPPTRPSSLSHRVDRELETIILKALEKEKPRRYQSVAEFGEDIKRYIAGEPIFARPPSSFYVLRKKLVKQRVRIAVAALAVALGVAGLWCGIWWRNHSLEQEHVHKLAEARRTVLLIQRDVEAGRAERSLGRAEALAREFPQLPEGLLVLSQALFKVGRARGDYGFIDRAMVVGRGRSADDPSTWAFLALLANIYRNKGDSRAEQLQAQADRDTPDTAEAWYLRSFTTLSPEQAVQSAEHAVRREPSEHLARLAWERLAYLYLQTENFESAVRAARELAELGCDHFEWLMFEGHVLVREGRYDQAAEQYARVAVLFPNQPKPYRCRALAYLCLKEYAKAVEDYSKAAERYSEEMENDRSSAAWNLYMRATPLWITGRREEAVADYRAFGDTQGSSTYADVRLFLVLRDEARVLRKQNRPAEAEEVLEQASGAFDAGQCGAARNSSLEKVFKCLAGELTPAELVAAAETPEQLCEAYYYAGEACLLEERAEEAREWFQKCVDTNLVFDRDEFPPDPMNEYHLACWRLKQLAADNDDKSDSGGG